MTSTHKVEKISFPSHEELEAALEAFKTQREDVSIYAYESVLLRAKQIIYVDWTKNEVTAKFEEA